MFLTQTFLLFAFKQYTNIMSSINCSFYSDYIINEKMIIFDYSVKELVMIIFIIGRYEYQWIKKA